MKLAALVTALSLAVGASGCALMADAIAHHNSGGTACIDTPVFSGIDLLIAAASTAAVVSSDASGGYYAVPIVFGASGVVGTISALRCKGDDSEAAASNAPPASNSAPSFGEAPVDPEAREATHEEMFGSGPPAPQVPLLKNGIPTGIVPPEPPKQLDPPKPPAVVGEPKPMSCKITPAVPCPDGYWCQLVEENTGQCVPMK